MSDARAAVYANELDRCIRTTVKLAEGIDADKRYVQARPGKAHPAWLIGHLTSALDNNVGLWALNAERMLPKGWGRPFAPDFAGVILLPITPMTIRRGTTCSRSTKRSARPASKASAH